MLNLQCCGTRKPSSKYRLGISSAKEFTTVGRGAGGVDELAASLDESQVMFGLVAINVGSGGMARTKYVFVTFLGAKCPMVKRMRATEKRGAAIDACGGGGMIEWEPEYLGCTLDAMLEKVLASVVADDGGDSESMSVSALREQALAEQALHQQELLEQELAAAIMASPPPTSSSKKRGPEFLQSMGSSLKRLALPTPAADDTAVEEDAAADGPPVAEAVQSVRDDKDPHNWVLITPKSK